MNLKTVVSKKQSTPNFPKNKHFLAPAKYTYVCVSWGKKCSFFGKIGVLCFFEACVLKLPLLPYYRRITHSKLTSTNKKFLQNTFNVFRCGTGYFKNFIYVINLWDKADGIALVVYLAMHC